jgi:hypothetical protein
VTQSWIAALQAVGTLATVATLIIYFFELRTVRGQLKLTQELAEEDRRLSSAQFDALESRTQGQNAFQVVLYLERPDHLQTRAHVDRLQRKDFRHWTVEDRRAADLDWRMWNIASVFEKLGVIPENFLERYYGGTIIRHWDILHPFIVELRQRVGGYRARDFEELMERTTRLRQDISRQV